MSPHEEKINKLYTYVVDKQTKRIKRNERDKMCAKPREFMLI